ncbi:MAG: hypothetical protein JJU24_08085 [Natronohydrobacter sp.]|nr:hypothetical protein [Natronohydrobacter sp.]
MRLARAYGRALRCVVGSEAPAQGPPARPDALRGRCPAEPGGGFGSLACPGHLSRDSRRLTVPAPAITTGA